MRIRSIKPDFWRSKSISSLPIEDRLLFVGLWSYVDDNGVGLDRLSLIAADLFADDLEQDPRETFARVSRGLARLSEGGRITRYTVENVDYLCVSNWQEHQRIDKPGKERYPLPTRDDALIRESVARPSRDSSDTLAPGEGEKGRREKGEDNSCSSDADAPSERVRIDQDFDDWYSRYPRKVGKGQAAKAYRAARKKTDHTTLVERLVKHLPAWEKEDTRYIPYPATWLNGERWEDEVSTGRSGPVDDGWREPATPPAWLFEESQP